MSTTSLFIVIPFPNLSTLPGSLPKIKESQARMEWDERLLFHCSSYLWIQRFAITSTRRVTTLNRYSTPHEEPSLGRYRRGRWCEQKEGTYDQRVRLENEVGLSGFYLLFSDLNCYLMAPRTLLTQRRSSAYSNELKKLFTESNEEVTFETISNKS
jgi:hypothetical protein